MASAVRIPLGAPGIYHYPDVPLRALTGVRMDVCAFVGVAPRGPARVPVFDEKWRDGRPCVEPQRPRRRTAAVAVESFDEYRRLYGAFEGPGLLPYAVAAFFEQGGRRAYIARIVHADRLHPENEGQPAVGTVGGASTPAGPLILRARNEGSWGNQLSASIRFTYTPVSFEDRAAASLTFAGDSDVPAGSLLRLTLEDGSIELRFVTSLVPEGRAGARGFVHRASLSSSVPSLPAGAELAHGVLSLGDGTGRTETHERLGLSFLHPRWMATVLCYESSLAYPDHSWAESEVLPDESAAVVAFEGGTDLYEKITPQDFFDDSWVLGNDEPGEGVHALVQLPDLSLVVAPDLYSPEPLAEPETITDSVSLAGPTFERCVTVQAPAEQGAATPDLEGLRLDPAIPADLAEITRLQLQLETLAEQVRSFIVLLDVPLGLKQRQILEWRSKFHSAYAAAYHPWLRAARRDDSRDALIRIPPSAVAAGIIARKENLFGVAHGPANELAAEVVTVDDVVSPQRHDELHPHGINVYSRERDGIRLTAARTLSRDPAYRQLSVRRLVTMIKRTLDQQTQWLVFEPNNSALRAEVRKLLEGFLRRLFRAGAFRGATEEESFFVKCDAELHPHRVLDAGQLIALVGVAPAEPLEFIVLRLSRDGDGTLAVEE
jgi:uncharacterized protein